MPVVEFYTCYPLFLLSKCKQPYFYDIFLKISHSYFKFLKITKQETKLLIQVIKSEHISQSPMMYKGRAFWWKKSNVLCFILEKFIISFHRYFDSAEMT